MVRPPNQATDTLLVASDEGLAYAKSHNYTFVRTDGYVITDNSTCAEM
jgi:hypothetical protein